MTTVIAEVAQAHDGSLGTAHAYIDAVARAGADAVKFQTHIAEAESTRDEPWRFKFSPQDDTRYDYWQRMEFTEEQWRGLRQHALDRGLEFLSSAFSVEAVDLLERIGGVDYWKVASGEVTNGPLFERMLETGDPILLSSGMSTITELDAAVQVVRSRGVAFTVLQCTSMYPTPPEKVGLNMLKVFRQRYDCPVGLSDHSGTVYSGLAAVALGADIVEVHVTFSREAFGPDVPASITTTELGELVRGVRFLARARTHPVDKDQLAQDLSSVRSLFTKSIVASKDLAAGTVLQVSDLALKKPGLGLPPSAIPDLVGRELGRDISRDERLAVEDLN